MTSLLMSSPPISILHRLFQCRCSNSRDVVASSPSFSRPAARAPRRACLQARTSTVGYWAAFSVGGSHKAVESSRKNIAKVQQSCFGLVQLFFNFWTFSLWFYLKFSNSLDLDWTCEMLQCGAHLLQNALTKRTVEAGNEKMTTPLTAAQVGVQHCPAVATIRGHSLMVTGRFAHESFR